MDEKKIIYIVVFLISVILINMTAGGKATQYYLVLVLISMLVTNTDKLKKMLGGNI